MKKSAIILFVHGYGSSSETDKFTKIPFVNKVAIDIDYDKGLKQALQIVEVKTRDLLKEYSEVVLVGHSLGGWVANKVAKGFDMPAVLIAPCLEPHKTRPEVVDVDDKFEFGTKKVEVLIENDDEVFDIPAQKAMLAKAPTNYHVEYFDGGHHRLMRVDDVALAIHEVCGHFPLTGSDSSDL